MELERLPAPWGKRELLLGMGLALACYLGGSLIGALLIRTLGWERSPWIGPALALAQLGLLLPPLAIMARYPQPLRLLGLDRFRWQMLVEVVVMLGVAFCGMIAWGLILLPLGLQAQQPILPLFGEGSAALIVAWVVGGVLAPLFEELVFRGFLFGGLLRLFSPTAAALGSAAFFGALHLQPFAFPVLFLLGALLATLYYRTGSLWPAILMHQAINSVALLAQYVAQQQGVL